MFLIFSLGKYVKVHNEALFFIFSEVYEKRKQGGIMVIFLYKQQCSSVVGMTQTSEAWDTFSASKTL